MNRCENHQARLLAFLYGLLEEEEHGEMLAHIASCAECRSALERAEEQRGLIAEAAKSEFPEVAFTPPSLRVADFSRTQTGTRRPLPWGRLALAASVLLAIGVGSLFGVRGLQTRQDAVALARIQLADSRKKLNDFNSENQMALKRLGREIQQTGEKIQQLRTDWQRQTAETERAIRTKKIAVTIRGPRNIQAGARNTFAITMNPRIPGAAFRDALAKAPMLVRVVNPESNKVLFERQLINPGNAVIDLPPDLPLRPGVNLSLEVVARLGKDGAEKVSEKLPLVPSLYMTHLTTDRPMYRAGETVRFRSLTLERFSLKPAQEDLRIHFRITQPNGGEVFHAAGNTKLLKAGSSEPIKGPDGKPVRGLGASEWKIAEDLAGGEYTLFVSEEGNRFPAERRKFLVNRYQAPRLNKELVFTRKSYGPGDEVEVKCQVSRVEGGAAVANQNAVASLVVDGKALPAQVRPTDAKGKVSFKFKLPDRLEKGDGSLSVQFTDGGSPETIVRPVPIVVKKLLVDFYPEGGDLVAEVPNRVYFQVRTTLDKPAELRGRIVDERGRVVATVQTLNDDHEAGVNQGMGAFTFVPRGGKKYELKIDAPIGIEGRHELPAAKAEGVVLNIPEGVVDDRIKDRFPSGLSEPVFMVLHNTGKDRKLVVGAYCRGRLVDNTEPFDIGRGEKRINLDTSPGVSGVYRITVFEVAKGAVENGLVPLAERLIYRRPVEKLKIRIEADKAVYHPGEKAKIRLKTTNEKDVPAPAILLMSAVDLSVLKLADEKTARSMPAQFYLSSEIQKADDLEYTDFLVSDHPKATTALDLLLGTQGWRRFAEQNPQELLRKHPADGRRLLLASGQAEKVTFNTNPVPALRALDEKFTNAIAAAEVALVAKRYEQTQRVQKQQTEPPVLQQRIETANQRLAETRVQLTQFERLLMQWGLAGTVALALLAGAGCLIIGLMRVASSGQNAVPYLITGASLLVLLFMASLGGTFLLMGGAFGREDAAQVAEVQNVAPQPMPQGPEMAAAPGAEADAAKGADKEMAETKHAERRKKMVPPEAPLKRDLDGAGQLQKRPTAAAGAGKGGAAPRAPMMKFAAKKALPVPAARAALPAGAPPGALLGAADQKHAFRFEAEQAKAMGGGGLRGMPAADQLAQRQLRVQDRAADLREGQAFERGRRMAAVARVLAQPFAVREYAHVHTTGPDKIRRDFTETLYWNPVLVLADGSAEVSFDLSDSTTQFQISCQGHTLGGRLGNETITIASRLPYSIEPKLPTEISSTDKVIIPLAIANDTADSKSVGLEVQVKGLKSLDQAGATTISRQVTLPGNRRIRELFRFEPAAVEGEATLNLVGRFDPSTTDSVERTFKIVPDGFPIVGSHSDMLEGISRHAIVLPESWVPGTLKCRVQVFPSTLADLQKGLEGLLREPCGCFEQSSSSNYPNVLILNYLKENQQNQPQVEERARRLLQNGYQRLTSFECLDPRDRDKRQGYEWFGQTAPPHEALTAYGLLQFRDMARVHPVDQDMVERTRKYLMGQRDGEGGFKRNTRAIDTFGRAPADITNAYIVWALTESGPDDVDRELNALITQSKDSKDPYFLALVGNSLVNRNKTPESSAILKKLSELQQADGHLQGTRTSITGSGGRDLQIETTALAILAWLKANRPEFSAAVNKAVRWIGTQRGGYGGFGATQSTILALKALIAHTRANRKTAEAGELRLFVHDKAEPVATRSFPAGCQEPILIDLNGDSLLKPGPNKIRVEITGKNAFPYTLSWTYRTLKPANPADCPVHLAAALDRASAHEGETVRLKAAVENKTGKGQGMTVAILGLPGGLSLPEDFRQLKDMARLRDGGTKPGLISFFEIRGRELVLYWRELKPDQKIEVDIDLICRLPGEFRGPASRAYLYYNADHKHWVEPVALKITAKAD